MDSIPLGLLILALIICLAFSAFFSASETAMMSLNRYKLKHLADEGNKRAKCASHLLKHTDRLIGTILLGNNFVNIAATSLGTLIGLRLYGDLGVLLSTIILTVVVLVFSEVAPKTLAATNAQRIALPVAPVLAWLVRILSPLVRLLNAIVRLILRPLGIKTDNAVEEALSNDELRSIVQSSQSGDDDENSEQQDMLLNVLELEDVSVSEAMVPRNELELEDILTHIVGDIGDEDTADAPPEIIEQQENLYTVEGGIPLRQLNRELGLKLPLDGPNTLSGLIIETLGNFPEAGTEIELPGCSARVLDFADGIVSAAEIRLNADAVAAEED